MSQKGVQQPSVGDSSEQNDGNVEKQNNLYEIVQLNVGGKQFATTRHTLLSIPDTFFTSLLDGEGLPTTRDKNGAIFIDRDPKLFTIILSYLRSFQLYNVNKENVDMVRHEAEFYGIGPLVNQLAMYDSMVNSTTCGGNLLFQVGCFPLQHGRILF